jgi:hypothetical protein
MSQDDKSGFAEFWSQIGRAYLRSCMALLWRIPLGFLVAVVVVLVGQCNFGSGPTADASCADVSDPWGLLSRLVAFLPNVLMFLPVLWGAILLNEWLNFKKDKPSGFIYGGWLNPNRPWVLSNLDRLAANTPWQGVAGVHIQQLGPDHSRATAEWREAQVLALVQGVVRRLTSLLRKPVEQREGLVRWHILANSGDELHITLKRQPTGHGDWVLSVDYHEWVGRSTPARLMRSVVTEFVCGAVAAPVVADVDGR